MMNKAPLSFLLMLISFSIYAQETVSISDFLKRKSADKNPFSIIGVYTETINLEDLVFLLRDKSGEIMIKLSDEGPEAAMLFRSEKIVPGDTLRISGVRKRIYTKEEGVVVGLYPAFIISHQDGPNHDLLASNWPPSFRGRGKQYFSEWVHRHLRYPSESRKRNSQGTVGLSFVVNEDGSVSDVQVKQSSGDPLLDEEAVRVVSSSPRWFPCVYNNQPVKFNFGFSIVFSL